jgi:MFS family permease
VDAQYRLNSDDSTPQLGEQSSGVRAENRVQAWFLVIFITLLTILSLLDRNVIALFLDDIKADLQISELQASFIYGGAFAITFSLVGLPAGWAVDRLSRRKIIFAGVSFWSLSTIACGLATGFPSMLLARAGVGAGEAALVPSAHSIISDSFPPKYRTLPFAYYAMGQKGGAGAALLIGGALAALFSPHMSYQLAPHIAFRGWQIILFAIGLPGIAIAFFIFTFAEPARSDVHTVAAERPGYIGYLRFMRGHWRYFTGLHLGFVMFQSVYIGIMGATPSFFARVHGWTPAEIGFWFGAAILVGPLASLPIHGWACDQLFRRGIRDIHLLYQLVMLPLALLPLCAAYLMPGSMVSLVLLGVGMTLIAGSQAASTASLQLSVSGDLRGKAASVWILIGGLSSLIGPSSVALINQKVFANSAMIGQSLALFVCCALLLAVLLFEFARRAFLRIPRSTEGVG